MPSVPTWWCGDPLSRDHVLANLTHLVVKSSSASNRFGPIFGDRLNGEQIQRLSDRIRARPRDFVAQEQLSLSTVPVFAGGRLQPRHVVLRSYMAASDIGFTMMPGGLTRVTASADTMVVSMQQGGGSKDTWVLSSGPVSSFTLLSSMVRPVEPAAAAAICRAVRRTISTGSAATSSAPRGWCACCGESSCA